MKQLSLFLVAALFVCSALGQGNNCPNNDSDDPCENSNSRCSLVSNPALLCRGEQFVLASSDAIVRDPNRASGATLYKCCSADCSCSSEDSCHRSGLWTPAETNTPGYLREARPWSSSCSGNTDLDNCGWAITKAEITADFASSGCNFAYFWCRDCRSTSSFLSNGDTSGCGGRQTNCGTASGLNACSGSVCTEDCLGREKWPDNSNRPLDSAQTLTVRQVVSSNPTDVSVVAPTSAVFTAAYSSGCTLTKASWYRCGSAGSCNFGEGTLVGAGEGTVTTSSSGGGITSSLTLSNTAANISGRRYYSIACPNSCASCTTTCAKAYYTTAASITVCSTGGNSPVIAQQPANNGVSPGSSVIFTSVASGTVQSAAWERKIGNGAWLPFQAGTLSGLTATLSFNVAQSDNGNQYRVVFSNCGATSNSNAASLCVRQLPCMFQLSDASVNLGFNVTFCTTQATGSNSNSCSGGSSSVINSPCDNAAVDSVQWEYSMDEGSTWSSFTQGTISGLPLSVGGVTSIQTPGNYVSGDKDPRVRVKFTNCAGTQTSNAARLSISCPTSGVRRQSVVESPSSPVVATAGASFTMTAKAEENANNGYVTDSLWQVSSNEGLSWTTITSGYTKSLVGPFASLTFPAVTESMSGLRYRMRFCNCDSGSDCLFNNDFWSEVVVLRVTCPVGTCKPIVSLQPKPVVTVPGFVVTFISEAASDVNAATWQRKNSNGDWVALTYPSFSITGTAQTTLTISNPTTSMSGDIVRAVFTNPSGISTSLEADFRVIPLPDDCPTGCDSFPDTYQQLPENCGSSPAGCTFRCQGCGTCTAVLNPEFSRQCEANIVLILDESGSISPFKTFVRNGVKQFLLSFAQTTTLGGTANLGVVEFSSAARLVTTSGNQGKMAALTTSWVNALTGYVDNIIGSPDVSGNRDETNPLSYVPDGCTNWGEAIARGLRPTGGSSQWQVPDGAGWKNQNPDVVLIFTDGRPTVHVKDTCDYHCNYQRVKPDGNIVGPCNGGDVGWSCFNSDIVKTAGVKVFLVGVGSVSSNIGTVQLLTGPREWDLQSTSFFNADYIVSDDFAALGNLFLKVVQGLCTCLQNTPVCGGTNSQCSASQFAARVRVTTTAVTTSTTFPRGTASAAYIYYNYVVAPETRVSFQFFNPTQQVTVATPDIVRTDLLDPCTVRRQVKCGNGCFSVSERQDLPRFFRESTDTTNLTGAFWPKPAACGAGFRKNYPSPPFTAVTSDSMVKYLYVMSDGISPCAAETFDQTLYEFFTDAGVTRGVNNLGSTPRVQTPNSLAAGDYPFNVNATCEAAKCGRDVELVFVIDESNSVTSVDYANMLDFLRRTILTFNLASTGVRFGVVWSNPVSDSNPDPATLQSGGTALITNLLTPSAHPKAAGSANFASRIEYALQKYWNPATTPPNGIRRELLTLVASNDVGSAVGRFDRLQANFTTLGVEAFAIGVGDVGAYLTGLLANISSPSTSFVHFQSYASSQFLVEQVNLLAPLYCPQGNLCGSCQGFCACTTAASCACPTCSSTSCFPRQCPGAASGCISSAPTVCDDDRGLCTDKACLDPAIGCRFTPKVTCNDNNNCTDDSCLPSTGACRYEPVAVDNGNKCTIGSCLPDGTIVQNPVSCPTSNACFNFACNATTGSCDLTVPTCNDGDPCTTDGCSNATGCTYVAITNVTAVCGTQPCQLFSCAPGGAGCVARDDPSPTCTCQLHPCANQTFCSNPVCMSTNLQCDTLPAEQVTACKSAILIGTPKRFCYDEPIANKCPTSNQCFDVACVNSGGLSGSCVTTATGGRCTSDLCNRPFCNNQTGCQVVPKAAADIALLCNDNNKCTTDTCTGGQCRYEDISSTCTTGGDKCSVASCSTTSGCQTRPKTAAELLTTCNDNNACTTDSCANNTCAYTTSVTCNPNDACKSFACNPSSGACVRTDVTCNDNNPCTKNSCNTLTGCVYTNLTAAEVNTLCRPSSCQQATCDTQCRLAPKDPVPPACNSDPCISNPCPNPVTNFCERTECINTANGTGITCENVPAGAERATCLANVTVSDRYCFLLPLLPCPADTLCTRFSCNAATSNCDETDLGAACPDTDICKSPQCIDATGCALVDKSAADIALLCNDNDECTTDSCANNACVYTDISASCTTADKCKVASCNSSVAGGCVTSDKTPAQVALVCNDNNACTADTCADDTCIYTPSVTCPTSNNCTTWQCNATSGTCFSTTISCDDGNKCTADSCDGAIQGGCVNTLITDPGVLAGLAVCNTPSCMIAECSLAGNGTCSFEPSQTASCACINFPCTNQTFCSDPVCLVECSTLAGAERTACQAAIADASAPNNNRYCYNRPSNNKQTCEAATDLCTVRTCVNGGTPTTGSCAESSSGLVCTAPDQCQVSQCDPVSGCVYSKKDAATIAALCDDDNKCTTDDCIGGQCRYTDVSSSCTTGGDKCLVAFCSSASGCQTRPKTPTELLSTCNDNNACTRDTCSNNTCSYTPSVTCQANDACEQFACNPVNGVCIKTTTSCADGNPCTIDSCNNVTGCVYTPRTQTEINQLCSPGSCQTASCDNGCVLTNVTTGVCSSNPCIASPCPGVTDNFCFRDVCINAATGQGITCESVPLGAQRDACLANVTNDPADRFCFLLPKSPCDADTLCATYSCNVTAGACDITNIGALCADTDICKRPVCNPTTGCSLIDKDASDIALLCDDGNACTIDSCSDNACRYLPVTCPTPTDMCLEAVCLPATGCSQRKKAAGIIAAMCNDTNLCTSDDCASNQCVYTPSVSCLNNTACVQYSCNALTGACDETRTVCNDTDICTTDTCNPTTGCVYTPLSQVQVDGLCNPGTCKLAQCAAGSNACNVTSDLSAACACQEFPCENNATFCTTPQCVSTTDTCNALPASQQLDCLTQVTSGVPRRFCADIPKNACPANTMCTTYTCNATGAGSCDATNIGALCSSNDICQDPSCDPLTGCTQVNKPAAAIAILCDDSNACTIDSCSGNSCSYTPRVCSEPSDKCLEAICTPATGCGTRQKSAAAIALLCTDNSRCTTDTCSSNTCMYTPSVTCSASNACQQFACNPATGNCTETRTLCNDGNPCTIDTCNSVSGCVYTQRTQDEINALCNPGSCEQATCTTACVNSPLSPIPPVCDSDPCISNPCPVMIDNFCQRTLCINQPNGSGVSCLNVPEGVERDECETNTTRTPKPDRYCYLSTLDPCPADNNCTTFACNPAGTCDETSLLPSCPDTDICKRPSCDDSSGCSLIDKSPAEIAILCDDSNACTMDSCENNTCVYTPSVCPVPTDQCLEAVCNTTSGCGTQNKAPAVIAALCNDSNLCTRDTCAGGECIYSPSVTCPTDSACALYVCNPETGLCDETLTTCNDGNECTVDSCNTTTGCVYTPLVCTDNSLCTTDSCDPLSGCVFTPVVCSSGSECTIDSCSPSTGCVYSNVVCNDGLVSTTDSCNATSGCVYTPISCDDQNNCTADVLTPSGCVFNPVACNDGDRCTTDSCVAPSGCLYVPITCTPADPICSVSTCSAASGTCQELPIICNDGNPCTVDTCDSALGGCQYTPFNCSGISTCFDYECRFNNVTERPECFVAGAVDCNDADSCTDDSCVEGIGCIHLNVTCEPTTLCNFPVGCIGTGSSPICILENITSLFDFCGTCLGDNTECFFSSVIGTESIVGISAGVAVGIAIAVVIAALLAAWFSKKGYDYYKAQSDNAAASMQTNPYFVNNEMVGEMA